MRAVEGKTPVSVGHGHVPSSHDEWCCLCTEVRHAVGEAAWRLLRRPVLRVRPRRREREVREQIAGQQHLCTVA
jgi:hypothetical protein